MDTSERMLRLLSLLQHHRFWTGADLAARLEVSERTLRRDVDRLRRLGYPVTSARGVDGGYQLEPSAAMPPLVLDADEAVALAIGLRATAVGAAEEIADASVAALGKLVSIMPPRLRGRVEAVGDVTVTAPGSGVAPGPSPGVLGDVAQACRDGVRLTFDYVAHDGVTSQRYVEPYRLVTLGRRWYLVAFDVDRADWRTFRADRMTSPRAARTPFDPRPLPAADLADHVARSIGALTSTHRVEVVVAAPAADVAARVGRWGEVEALGRATCRLVVVADSFDWPVALLVWLGADVEVIDPPEFREHLAAVAARLEPRPRPR